jgi:hypothetical protein
MKRIRLQRDNIRHVVIEQIEGPIWWTKCGIKVCFAHIDKWTSPKRNKDCGDCFK